MKIRNLFFIAFLSVSMLVQAQVKLSFNPEKGQKYSYLFETEQDMKQTFMGQELPTQVVMTMLMDMDISEKNNDETTLTSTYNAIKMSIANPMMSVEYDSQRPKENPTEIENMIATIFLGLIGKSFSVNIDQTGSVKSVSGMDELIQGLLRVLPQDNPAMQQMSGPFLQSFNDDAMKNMFEQSFKIYPANPVNVGDSWEGNITTAIMGMNQTMNNTYMLKAIEGNTAVMDVASTFVFNPEGSIEGEISGSQSGQMSLDVKTGMPQTSSVIQKYQGKLNAQGAEILLAVEGKVTFQLQK